MTTKPALLLVCVLVGGCGSVTVAQSLTASDGAAGSSGSAGAAAAAGSSGAAGAGVDAGAELAQHDAAAELGPEVGAAETGPPDAARSRPMDLASCKTIDAWPSNTVCLKYSDGTICSNACVLNGDYVDGPCYAPRTWDGISSDTGPPVVCVPHVSSCAACP